ncbi:MAG: hypothetical protein M3083_16425 [Actinomycetota bacterium]|nr:hypothetical protein [Actinomycetota bacterium]
MSATSTSAPAVGTTPPTVALTAPPACGPYSPPPDITLAGPVTTTPVAPTDPQLASRLLRLADIACSRPTTLPAEGDHIPQLRPCGYAFDNTSGATGHASIMFQVATLSINNQLFPYVEYVQEDVASYPNDKAGDILAGFRSRVATCPKDSQGTSTDTEGGGWTIAVRDLEPVADDRYGISLTVGEPGSYLLTELRQGSYIAFLRVRYTNLDRAEQQLPRIVSAAATRLAGR